MTADHSELKQDIVAYVAGDDAAGDRVCATLDRAVREAVCGFFPPQDADREDIIQDSLLAMLEYLRRAEDCPDNPEAFAVTIALNRCRNLHQWRKRRPTIDIDDAAPWLPGDAENPLDRLHDEQVRASLVRWLGSQRQRAVSAATGSEALRLLSSEPVDVVLLELKEIKVGVVQRRIIHHST